MAGLRSPHPFFPPISPHRAASPTMLSPTGRRGRATATSEESRLRDLSPSDTLRAFTEKPVPYDTTVDEYKIFACIDSLTPAERDLGARVAKAAQRLKSWCQEIEQWGWSGSFEPPSEEHREQRRRSIEMRIREHIKDSAAVDSIAPLEYWGSLLSVEVKAHETRLDEIGDELLALDIEELKEHVLDIHGPNKSRPTSAGYEASRPNYMPMDDFSFLITQTLLSALPHHYQLGDKLNTWTARVSVLRDAPRYLADLKTAQKAMRLGWDAIEPPNDASDAAFDKWKEAVDTISGVLQGKVSDLGQRLDSMLDALEGREDCLPEDWIDVFEGVEGNYGRWEQESRRRVIGFDVRRRVEPHRVEAKRGDSEALALHSNRDVREHRQDQLATGEEGASEITPNTESDAHGRLRTITALKRSIPDAPSSLRLHTDDTQRDAASEPDNTSDHSDFEEGDTVVHNELDQEDGFSPFELIQTRPESTNPPDSPVIITTATEQQYPGLLVNRPQTPISRRGSIESVPSIVSLSSSPRSIIEDSPSITARHAKPPKPELNAAMGKRRQLKIVKDEAMDEAPPWPPTQFSKQVSPNSAEDLDRKISDILTTIPAHIRLTSGAGADAAKPARGGLSSKGSRGYLRATRSINGLKSPELTLSPAKPNFDSTNAPPGRKSAAAMRGDNDIKLYHLTQPGREQPIKLFIRRVGENGERVMVRVGGGWADLGEYLRQYAEHHGRRAISEGKFEILGLQVKNPDGSPRPQSAMSKRDRRPESAMSKRDKRPESAMSKRDRRPESAMSKRDRRFSGGHTVSPHITPPRSIGRNIFKDDSPPPMPNLTGTPIASNANPSAPPSTDSSRHSWTGNEVGLAGPKTKKLDLSGEKLEWIEGMMKQARTVSDSVGVAKYPEHGATAAAAAPTNTHKEGANSRPGSRHENKNAGGGRKSEFGNLGRVGGTKRIFLKNGGGLGGNGEH